MLELIFFPCSARFPMFPWITWTLWKRAMPCSVSHQILNYFMVCLTTKDTSRRQPNNSSDSLSFADIEQTPSLSFSSAPSSSQTGTKFPENLPPELPPGLPDQRMNSVNVSRLAQHQIKVYFVLLSAPVAAFLF